MTGIRKKRCDTCQYLRGFQSFGKGRTTCKDCQYKLMKHDYENNGKMFYQTCRTCHEKKNLFKDFYNVSKFRKNTNCKVCASLYVKRLYSTKPRCVGRFEFNGKRLCKTCDEIKESKYFIGDRTSCRECLGMTPVAMKPKPYTKPLAIVTESEAEERARRIKRKRYNQAKFVRKFNRQLGVSA